MDIEDLIGEMRGKDPDSIDGTPDEVRSKTPDQLHQLVEVLDAHLRSLHQDEDTGELRDLTVDEDKAFRYGLKVREAALKRIEEHRAVSEVFSRRPSAVKKVYANLRNGLEGGSVTRMGAGEARDAALRVLDERRSAAHLNADEKDHIERQVRHNSDVARRIVVTENENYRNAWMKMVTQVDGAMLLEDEERQALRAYAEYRAASSSSASGGYGVPVKLAA